MKSFKYLAMAFLALAAVSCEELAPEQITLPEEKQEFVVKQITLDAKKGNNEISRIYIGDYGEAEGTIYHWNETDEVGVFALNSGSVTKNYEATIKNVVANDKNNARFVSLVEYAPDQSTAGTDLFIYWPYNSSNVISNVDQSVVSYLKETGVQIRTADKQDQNLFKEDAGDESHPSVNITKYGAAFDMTTCDEEGVAKFELHHATAYLQFNLYGAQGANSDTNYGNGRFKVTDLTVRLGKVQGMVTSGLLAEGSTFTPVQIAGNFTYNLPTYNAGGVKAEDVTMLKSGGSNHVSVSLSEPQTLGAKSSPVPVFAVVNASNITATNVNAIEAVATVVEYNENNVAVNSYTRTRYINLGGNVIKGGDYYKISFKVDDPVDEGTALDAIGGSNCYIVPAPGKYLFHVNYPGNGVVPANATASQFGLKGTVDADGKLRFFDENNMGDYEMRYLWASGTTFDNIKKANSNLNDDQVVEEVVEVSMYGTNVMLDVKNVGEELKGNLVVALSKKGSNEIIWSWHIWFGRPNVQHYNFPTTRPVVGINNEHWYMLDRNIGAETTELGNPMSYGLYYQLGRHTPFITPSGNGTWPNWNKTVYVNKYFAEGYYGWRVESMVIDNDYPYARPMTMNSAMARHTSGSYENIYDKAWVAADEPAAEKSKTFFDPCPLGYKLPTTREWDNFKENEWERTQPRAAHSGIFGYAAPYNVHQSGAPYVNYIKADTVTNSDGTTTITETGGWSKNVNFQRWNDTEYVEVTDSTAYAARVGRYGDVAAILNARYAAGDRFTHVAKGRTYYSTTLAGGVATETHFPNTGVIEVSGTTATVKYINETDTLNNNFALWAAGRMELDPITLTNTGAYSAHWFGPMDWYNVSFSPREFLDWTCYMPWYQFSHSETSIGKSIQKAYGPLGTRPYNIAGIDGTWGNDEDGNGIGLNSTIPKNSGNYAGQAVPVRCIREYNSTSAIAE